MNQSRNSIATKATKALVLLMSLWATALAYATQAVGTVTHLSGPLLAKKTDGTVKILSQKSSVEQGDTLVSEKDTYARIKFIDNSEITLRPSSQLKIDSFVFEQDKQEKDSASFSLVKGGLRAVTGMLGKRSKERFGMITPTATIGIRGTTFVAEYVAPPQEALTAYGTASIASAASLSSSSAMTTISDSSPAMVPLSVLPLKVAPGLQMAQISTGTLGTPGASRGSNVDVRAPGLYVQVFDGMITLSNNGGSQHFSAGQFGYTPNLAQVPIQLPSNPGMKFSPPPAFSSSTATQGGATTNNSSSTVDCEVR